MKIWYNNIIDTERHVVEVQGDRIRIGRAAVERDRARQPLRRRRGGRALSPRQCLGAGGAGHERRHARRSPTLRRRAVRHSRQPDDLALSVFAHARSAERRRDHARASAAVARRQHVDAHPRHPRRAAAADGPHGRHGRDALQRRRIPAAPGANARQHRPQPRRAGQRQLAAGGPPGRLRPARSAAVESDDRADRPPRPWPVYRSPLEPPGDGRAGARKRSRRHGRVHRKADPAEQRPAASPSGSTPSNRSSGRPGTRSATASTKASSRTWPCDTSRRN